MHTHTHVQIYAYIHSHKHLLLYTHHHSNTNYHRNEKLLAHLHSDGAFIHILTFASAEHLEWQNFACPHTYTDVDTIKMRKSKYKD